MLCEDVGVQLLGSKTELRRLLSTMLFGGWGAAAVYNDNAGGVQLHFGRGVQETVLKSCEWNGVPAKAFMYASKQNSVHTALALLQLLQLRLIHYSSPLDEWQLRPWRRSCL